LRCALACVAPEIKEIDRLYHIGCDCGDCVTLADGNEDNVQFGQSFGSLVEQALQNIYKRAGGSGEVEIDPHLFSLNNIPLQKGTDKTFASFGVEFGERNERFISQFKDNTAIFAAFKSHKEAETLSKLIRNEKGDLRSFYEFQKVAAPVIGKYNKVWLQTEYNMVVRSARVGAQWQNFQEKKHIFPNLEYMRTSSTNPRPEHGTFVGTILPIDHPWWNTHTPPLSWNCKCSIRQTRADETPLPEREETVPPVFQNNPGTTASPLNIEAHPYAKNVSEDVKKAVSEIVENVKETAEYKKQLQKRYGKEFEIPIAVPKKKGYIVVEPGHGKTEKLQNIKSFAPLAKMGMQVELIKQKTIKTEGLKHKVKTHDAFVVNAKNKKWEAKVLKNYQSLKNLGDKAIFAESQGAEVVLFDIYRTDKFNLNDLLTSIKYSFELTKLKAVCVMLESGRYRVITRSHFNTEKYEKMIKKMVKTY